MDKYTVNIRIRKPGSTSSTGSAVVLVEAKDSKTAKWKAYYLYQKDHPEKNLDASYGSASKIVKDYTDANPSVR